MHLLTQVRAGKMQMFYRLEAVCLALVSSGAVAGGGGTNKNINRLRDPHILVAVRAPDPNKLNKICSLL